jgi:hypothetical protein
MTAGLLRTGLALAAALAQSHGDHMHPPAVTLPGGWVKYEHKAGFSLEHPGNWRTEAEGAGAVHFSHPSKPAHLFASAFLMPEGGSLEEFADFKFGIQAEFFKATGPKRPMNGEGWTGLVQDAEASEYGERALRRILCARHEVLYVSLALYVDPTELAEHPQDYERLFSSLRFGRPPAPQAPQTP